MPVVFPTYEGGDPRPALSKFIMETRDFLDELVMSNRGPNGRRLFYSNLLAEMRAAWSEAYPNFARTAEATRNISEARLADHGLVGAQLQFKLATIRFLHERHLSIIDRIRRFIGGMSPTRRLIQAIDTLLSSILGAVGAGEGIKEIKEYIEHSLAD